MSQGCGSGPKKNVSEGLMFSALLVVLEKDGMSTVGKRIDDQRQLPLKQK